MNFVNLISLLGINGAVQGAEVRARCPLHDDSNPSFSMNAESGVWICHRGCGSGTFSTLVERVLDCNYQEARAWIDSNGVGNTIEQLEVSIQRLSEAFSGAGIGMQQVAEAIQANYWHVHYASLNNRTIPQWFLDRGFSWSSINKWDIRHDQSEDAIVIPVKWEDKLVGTITRPLNGTPKYRNSPNLPRSKIFFGEISHRENEIIICEGVLDTIWLWQNGYNAAGLLGTYMSQEQANILSRYRFGEITLALDNDAAGRLGTVKTAELLIVNGWLHPQIKVLKLYRDRKDPQDCSPEELKMLYDIRPDYIQWLGNSY